MNDFNKDIIRFKNEIEKILRSNDLGSMMKPNDLKEFKRNLGNAKKILSFVQNQISQRDTIKKILYSIKTEVDIPLNDKVKGKRKYDFDLGGESKFLESHPLLRTVHEFSHLRFISISSYLSITWGIYDNITKSFSLILGLEKGKTNLIKILNDKNCPISNYIKNVLKKEHELPCYIFYQMRNIFLHGDDIQLKIFEYDDKNNIFHFRSDLSKKILKLCKNNLGKESANEEEISKFFDLPSQCLLDLLFKLENKIDQLASRLLSISLDSLKIGGLNTN